MPNSQSKHRGTRQIHQLYLCTELLPIQKQIERNDETSYTNQLFRKGINKVAQKVGEEAVELVIEAMDQNDELFKNEAADLLFHFLILLKAKNMNLEEIERVLEMRVK